MIRALISLLIFASFGTLFCFTSDAQSLGEESLTRLRGDTLLKEYQDSFRTGEYNRDLYFYGQPEADNSYTEHHSKDGRADYKDEDGQKMGDWFVRDDQLCYKYDLENRPAHCFYIFRTERGCVYEYYRVDPRNGGETPLFVELWNSRNAREENAGACADNMVS